MKDSAILFLRKATPFLVTLALWRLSVPMWNPAGILAMIPIFYCSFVRPVKWFAPFAIFVCFLIDYKFDTRLYWMSLYLMAYAINGFQTYVDITRMDKNALDAFMIFFGAATLILAMLDFSFYNLLRTVWLFAWCAALYLPITELIKRARHD